jgi:hypothetical protein
VVVVVLPLLPIHGPLTWFHGVFPQELARYEKQHFRPSLPRKLQQPSCPRNLRFEVDISAHPTPTKKNIEVETEER